MKFYEKIVEVSPNIYVLTSSESKWDAELRLDDLHSLVKSAFDEYRKTFPGLYAKWIAPKWIIPMGNSITVSTVKQAGKYNSKCFISKHSIGEATTGPLENVHIQADHKKGEEFARIFKSVLFHELAHKIRIPDIKDDFDEIMENKKIWDTRDVSWIRENEGEYFAELFAIWMGYPWFYGKVLGVNDSRDGVSDIREKLKKYDNKSYDLLKDVLDEIEDNAMVYIPMTTPVSEEIRCDSISYAYTKCQTKAIKTPKAISLIKQESKTPCVLNRNFGIASNVIYTDKGCRGFFKVTF